MNTEIRNSGRLAGIVISGFFSFIVMAMTACEPADRRIAKSAEQLFVYTYNIYDDGTFNEATNALAKYIRYLELNQTELSRFRNVDILLSVAYRELGYMYMCGGLTNAACDQLNLAYKYYRQMANREGFSPKPRSEFVDLAIRVTEDIDARHSVQWKCKFPLKTNTVANVKELFGK